MRSAPIAYLRYFVVGMLAIADIPIYCYLQKATSEAGCGHEVRTMYVIFSRQQGNAPSAASRTHREARANHIIQLTCAPSAWLAAGKNNDRRADDQQACTNSDWAPHGDEAHATRYYGHTPTNTTAEGRKDAAAAEASHCAYQYFVRQCGDTFSSAAHRSPAGTGHGERGHSAEDQHDIVRWTIYII